MNRVIGKIKGSCKYWKGWTIIIPCDDNEFDEDNENNSDYLSDSESGTDRK